MTSQNPFTMRIITFLTRKTHNIFATKTLELDIKSISIINLTS
jgi:hypothetical protein